MNWICNWCGAKFEEPDYERYGDDLGELGIRYYEERTCPHCGDDDIEEEEW